MRPKGSGGAVAAAQRRAVPGPAHKLISANACVTRHAVNTRTVTSWVHRGVGRATACDGIPFSACRICNATGLSQELIAYALSVPEAFATAMLKRLDANGDEQLDASELKPLPAGIKKVPDSSGRLLSAYCMRIVPRVSASTDRCRRTAACVRARACARARWSTYARALTR